ncbi:hypothetical protein AB1L30_04425 [Bremerella sp. JC817]|uniref:hypothetical protein n=1 Tax=Bremerella sp. JC817 TaxID=3231756 RepID=UPI00345AE06C
MQLQPPHLEEQLLDLVKNNQNHFWVGQHPPFDFATANITDSINFRLTPGHHHRYDVVWCYELDPATLVGNQYELLFDELLRLIGEEGKLVVRYSQSEHFTVIRLKHFLGRRYNTEISIESESQHNGVFTTVFAVKRLNLDQYRRTDWSLAIITQGTRVENVVRFLESVRSADPNFSHEIIVCGPENEAYEKYQVRYHSGPANGRPYRDKLAEISRKKNDLAEIATGANLLIIHDRYVLDEGFFDGFDRYGYDFDFLAVLQQYECGSHFPAYVGMIGPELTWQVPLVCEDYNQIHPNQFLNGGFLIAKTETLRAVRFNDMLLWNQAEDMELSYTFRLHSLPPRMNCFSRATTLGITPEYTKTFVPFPKAPSKAIISFKNILKDSGRKIERRLRPYLRKLKKRSA